MTINAILVTGGFDPLHSGHIKLLKDAHKFHPNVIVGLNSDEWLARKKGKPFMPYNERKVILEELNCVNKVISFDDKDNTANDAIKQCLEDYYTIIFANVVIELRIIRQNLTLLKMTREFYLYGV